MIAGRTSVVVSVTITVGRVRSTLDGAVRVPRDARYACPYRSHALIHSCSLLRHSRYEAYVMSEYSSASCGDIMYNRGTGSILSHVSQRLSRVWREIM